MDSHVKMTRSILWKLDTHVLPPLAVLWLANFIDRSNIGNARIDGLERDTKLVGDQYNIILAVFYVTYIAVEMPSNMLLKKMKPNRWIPFLVMMWGIVTTLTSLVQDYKGVLAIRIFLGFTEGGILPGMVLYLSTLYKRHELQLRVGIFYASASLSGAFGGLLATAISKMTGIAGLDGWRWIFILEGIATVIAGGISIFILPESLENAHFLTEEERIFAVRRFHMDDKTLGSTGNPEAPTPNSEKKSTAEVRLELIDLTRSLQGAPEEKFEWYEVVRGFKDIQTWLTGFAYFGLLVSLYSYSLFLPTIVSGLGYSGSQAQLHTVPPYIPAAFLTVLVAFLSDKLRWRGPFVLICLPIAIVGYILAIVAKTNNIRYLAVFLMAAGVYPAGPCILSILPNNSAGHYKKATTTGLQLAIANSGGFLATFAYTPDQAPRYVKGHAISLAFVSLSWILIACNVAYCSWENKQRALGRRQDNITKHSALVESGKSNAPIGDRHPDFRFTI
ncbi:MFS transporter [Crepidotus variabilis]|uniref:MFS transporter n=1 Tax=Crepidotus variabilis TaxID=179855 RepID=A0A9P6ES03_9AGAR|nr:MFS transporter [Crepidotus variabilis]